jgi:hypothetical protein
MGPMSRGILAGVAVVLVSAATAVVTTMSLRPGGGGETATANVARKIFPVGPAEQMLWPTDRAWVFSVRLQTAGADRRSSPAASSWLHACSRVHLAKPRGRLRPP